MVTPRNGTRIGIAPRDTAARTSPTPGRCDRRHAPYASLDVTDAPSRSRPSVSEIFDPEPWDDVPGFDDLTDLTYHRAVAHGTVRIAFDRPDVLNAFRPHTVDELLPRARARPHDAATSAACCSPATARAPKNGKWAFCTGGDQRIRGRAGYQYAEGETADTVDQARQGRGGGCTSSSASG